MSRLAPRIVARSSPAPEPGVAYAYDGSNALMRTLFALGWGPLLNLGYFTLPTLPLLLLGLSPFQRRLIREAIGLLRPQKSDVVLDVACGYGWSSRSLARRADRVVGIDFLRPHVDAARQRYGRNPKLRFLQGDACKLAATPDLGVAAGEVDKILCVEAAFHFGVDGRARFLQSAFEMLRPGGRLVLVDFTWKSLDERIDELDADHFVRGTWQFDDFEPFQRYLQRATRVGFQLERVADWSVQVFRLQQIGDVILRIGLNPMGRFLMSLARPQLRRLTNEDWQYDHAVVAAMKNVCTRTRYVALCLRKPGNA